MKTTPGLIGFLRLRDDMDFANAPCGCILERAAGGNGSAFLMCENHSAIGIMARNVKRALILLRAFGVIDMRQMIILIEVLHLSMTRKVKWSTKDILSVMNQY